MIDLVKTDNKVFNKVVIVFSSLCSELQSLKAEAATKFYAPLALYGERVIIIIIKNKKKDHPPPSPVSLFGLSGLSLSLVSLSGLSLSLLPKKTNNNCGLFVFLFSFFFVLWFSVTQVADDMTADGDSQVQLGRMLPLLQNLAMFVTRVQRVVKNLMQQLGVIHAPTPAAHCIDTSDVFLTVITFFFLCVWLPLFNFGGSFHLFLPFVPFCYCCCRCCCSRCLKVLATF